VRRNRFLIIFNENELQGFLTQIECDIKDERDRHVAEEIRREIEIRKNESVPEAIPAAKS